MEEDNEFFVLVLGVLAAILLVISWWFTTGGTGLATTSTDSITSQSVDDDTDAHDDDAAAESHEDDDDDSYRGGDERGGDEQGDDEQGGDDTDDDADDSASSDTAAGEDASDDGSASASGSETGTADVPVAATVFDAIAANPELSVVTGLLRDTDLDQVLASGGPFTVFAPSNDAMNEAASSDTTLAVLTADSENVLTYHVVPGEYTVDDLADIARGGRSTELTTVQGETISLTLESGNVVINGSTTIQPTSLFTGNGFVHTLDNVLVPPVGALNALVELDPILFATGSADIEPESFATLDSFIEVLNGSNVDVTIEGHTDSSGDPILNQNLSQSRARSVLNYLVANGVDEARLDAEGFGAARPVADNETEEGRALNRRIEFTVG